MGRPAHVLLARHTRTRHARPSIDASASMSLASADDAAQCWLTVRRKRVHAREQAIPSMREYYTNRPRITTLFHPPIVALSHDNSLHTRDTNLTKLSCVLLKAEPDAFQSSPCSYPTRSQDNLNSALRLVSSSGACHRASDTLVPRAPLPLLQLYHCSPSDFSLSPDLYAQR